MKLRNTTLPAPPRRRRTPAIAAAAVAAALALSACSGPADEAADPTPSSTTTTGAPTTPADTTPTPTPTPTPTSEAPAGPTLSVSIAGDDVAPNAEEISLGLGEPLLIAFDSDRAGELHVHSKPEQYVEFAAGTSEQTLVVETPGEVEVEDHDTGAVVAVIQVS